MLVYSASNKKTNFNFMTLTNGSIFIIYFSINDVYSIYCLYSFTPDEGQKRPKLAVSLI
jgi:hypothetical protein